VQVSPLWLKTGKESAAPPNASPTLSADLAVALEVLGIALAHDMPADVREDVADTLAKLARRRGAGRHQAELLTLLSAPPGKAQRTA
jgi:hypothetical protein